jgi:hypothetical protein
VVSPSIIPVVAPMMKPSSAVTFVIAFVSLVTLMPEPGIGARAGHKRQLSPAVIITESSILRQFIFLPPC